MSGKNFIAIASLVLPVGATSNQNKIIDNFKLMRITATQMIAHCSVNFNLIRTSFEILAL